MTWLSPPLTFCCRGCGWTHTTPGPVGDVRILGLDHFTACPSCGGQVETRRALWWETLTAKKRQVPRRR